MLFNIRARETVQLQAADFHSAYRDAVKWILYDRLFQSISFKYGKVISINVADSTLPTKALLFHRTGVASFDVGFEAIIEKTVIGEITLAVVNRIVVDAAAIIVYLLSGASVVQAYLDVNAYDASGGDDRIRLKVGQRGTEEYERVIECGQVLRVKMNSESGCSIFGTVVAGTYFEDSSNTNEESEDERSNTPEDE